jgi:hypothetical protein
MCKFAVNITKKQKLQKKEHYGSSYDLEQAEPAH